MSEEPGRTRIVELRPRRVAGLRFEGAAPASAGIVEHWRRFHECVERGKLRSADPDVLAIAYTPPGRVGGPMVTELCVPVDDGFRAEPASGARTWTLPGGRFVLVAARLEEIRELHREARGYAAAHGLAVERGGIEIYRPSPTDAAGPRVEAGVRIHD